MMKSLLLNEWITFRHAMRAMAFTLAAVTVILAASFMNGSSMDLVALARWILSPLSVSSPHLRQWFRSTCASRPLHLMKRATGERHSLRFPLHPEASSSPATSSASCRLLSASEFPSQRIPWRRLCSKAPHGPSSQMGFPRHRWVLRRNPPASCCHPLLCACTPVSSHAAALCLRPEGARVDSHPPRHRDCRLLRRSGRRSSSRFHPFMSQRHACSWLHLRWPCALCSLLSHLFRHPEAPLVLRTDSPIPLHAKGPHHT